MSSLTHLQLVSVPGSDQDRALSSYVETLGFDLLRDQPTGPDQRWVEVAPHGGQASVALVTWFPTMPPGSVQGLVLATGDVDRAHGELSECGVVFRDPLTDSPWATVDDLPRSRRPRLGAAAEPGRITSLIERLHDLIRRAAAGSPRT